MDTLKVWKPEPGHVLHGVVREVETVATKYGPTLRAIIDEEETAEPVLLWIGSAVLKSEWMKASPQPGEKVAVKYEGKHPEKGYYIHSLDVDRPTIQGELPWEIADDKAIATQVIRQARRGSRRRNKEPRERLQPAPIPYDPNDPFC